MSTSAADIVDAIDAAIFSWAGKPIQISVDGHTSTYRSLKELTDARTYYQGLVAAARTTSPVRFQRIKPGGVL